MAISIGPIANGASVPTPVFGLIAAQTVTTKKKVPMNSARASGREVDSVLNQQLIKRRRDSARTGYSVPPSRGQLATAETRLFGDPALDQTLVRYAAWLARVATLC